MSQVLTSYLNRPKIYTPDDAAFYARYGDWPIIGAAVGTTWNPDDKHLAVTLSNGNLTAYATDPDRGVRATTNHSSGKYYFELHMDAASVQTTIGLAIASHVLSTVIGGNAGGWSYSTNGTIRKSGAVTSGYMASSAAGDIIGVAADLSAGTIDFYKNNTLITQLTGMTTGVALYPALNPGGSTSQVSTVRFMAADLTYTPPSGFSAWG